MPYQKEEPDSRAFDAMNKLNTGKASNLFTESAYNALSTDKERGVYDKKAHSILQSMYAKDKAKREFKDIDFGRYVDLLSSSLFEERAFYPRDEDEEMGDFFLDVYEGDFDQFKASALNAIVGKGKTSFKERMENRKGEYIG